MISDIVCSYQLSELFILSSSCFNSRDIKQILFYENTIMTVTKSSC